MGNRSWITLGDPLQLALSRRVLAMEANETQLKRLFTALRAELQFQWRAKYVELVPGGVLALSFEHATNS